MRGILAHRPNFDDQPIDAADKEGKAYMDEALKPSTDAGHTDDFVAGCADKIPDTYGAPKREAAAPAE